MRFDRVDLEGVYVLSYERSLDARGTFERTFSASAFRDHGLDPHVEQCGTTVSTRAGTLRGLHWQEAPAEECKLIRCVRGAIWDVAVDIRPSSLTYLSWFAIELSEDEPSAVYLPKGVAHGYVTRADASEVAYQLSAPHTPAAARGARYDDPAFGIEWPQLDSVIVSERDLGFPPFRP